MAPADAVDTGPPKRKRERRRRECGERRCVRQRTQDRRCVFVILYLLSRYRRPEWPLQRLRRCRSSESRLFYLKIEDVCRELIKACSKLSNTQEYQKGFSFEWKVDMEEYGCMCHWPPRLRGKVIISQLPVAETTSVVSQGPGRLRWRCAAEKLPSS